MARRKRKFGKRMTPKAEREARERSRVPGGWFGGACQKITYADKTAAKLALRAVQAKRRHQEQAGTRVPGKRGEQVVYRCQQCRGWHLTSQARPRGGRVLMGRRGPRA